MPEDTENKPDEDKGGDAMSSAVDILKGQGFEEPEKHLKGLVGKSHADSLVSYANAAKKIGSMVSIPGKDATEEQKREFAAKTGCPKTAADYKVTKPELPKGMEYSDELEKAYRDFAHKAGHSQAAFEANYNFYHQMLIDIHKHQTEAGKKAIETGMAELKTKWADDNDKNHEIVKRGFKKYGTPELAKMMEETELGSHPAMVDFVFSILKLDTDLMEADYVPAGGAAGEKTLEKAKKGDKKAKAKLIFDKPPKK